jgi:hypothetical protein
LLRPISLARRCQFFKSAKLSKSASFSFFEDRSLVRPAEWVGHYSALDH